MATCKTIIQEAIWRASILPADTAVNATLLARGLTRLKGLYLQMVGDGTFGQFKDVLIAAAYTANEQERVYNQNGSAVTIPATVTDRFTGKTRAPKDGAMIMVINPTTTPWTTSIKIYNAMLGWEEVNGITLNGNAPLSGRCEEQIKNLLAALLCDEGGLPMTPLLIRNAGIAKAAIGAKYDVKREAARPDYF